MTSPLDELRNTAKSIQQKKEENLKKTKEERLRHQEMLAKNSEKRQRQVQAEAKAMADKSKKAKIAIMSIVLAFLMAFFLFSLHVFLTGGRSQSSQPDLISNGEMELNAKDNDYVPLKIFITKTIADFAKNKDGSVVKWYSTLPAGKRERYAQTMRKLGLNATWTVREIRKDPKRERFSIKCQREGKKRPLFFDVVYNDEMEFEIVKVY